MSDSKVVLLVDWVVGDNAFWLSELLAERGSQVVTLGIPDYSMRNREVKWRKVLLWWQYLVLGYRGVQLARRSSAIVVSWNFIPGIFAVLVSRILPSPRVRVVSLNAIAYRKGTIYDFVRGLMYRTAFASGRLWLTVNSEEVRRLYEEQFGFLPERVEVLHDCWTRDYELGDPGRRDEGHIFVGGEAARDWPLVLEVAARRPEVRFELVARRKDWPPAATCPPNVHLQFDTSDKEFYGLVEGSRLVLIPLSSTVTAGLIVLIRSALLGRLVLATRTPATEACYPAELDHLLVHTGDAIGFCTLIDALWHDDDVRVEAARSLQDHVYESRTPHEFADRVADLVRRAGSESTTQ